MKKFFHAAVLFAVALAMMLPIASASAKDVWFYTENLNEVKRNQFLDFYLRTESIVDKPMDRPFNPNIPEDVSFTVVSIIRDIGNYGKPST